jgi:Uncharacterized protein conserved in bacteria (DUF2188)
MTNKSKSKSWINILIKIFEAFFKISRSKPKTWNQHVVPYKDGWAVRREGNKRITSKHKRQDTAIRKAKRLAKKYNADVIIHRKNGTIRDRIKYD